MKVLPNSPLPPDPGMAEDQLILTHISCKFHFPVLHIPGCKLVVKFELMLNLHEAKTFNIATSTDYLCDKDYVQHQTISGFNIGFIYVGYNISPNSTLLK